MMKLSTREKTLLALILLLAAFLRLAWIDWSLPGRFHTATYNADESTALTCLQAMDPAKLDFNPVSEKHPHALLEGTFNLYTYGALLKALSLANIVKLVPDKDYYYENIGEMAKLFLTGRLLSAFYGVLTVAAVFLLAGRLYGMQAGLLAAFFTAVLPAHVAHSRYIIMNVPGTFWIVICFIFLRNIAAGGCARDYVLTGIAGGLAVATRISGAPLALMLPLAHFLAPAQARSARHLALGAAAAAAAFALGAPYTFLDFPSFKIGFKMLSETAAPAATLPLAANFAVTAGYLREALGLPLLLAGLAGLAAALIRRSKADLLLAAWTLPLLLLFFRAGFSALPGRMLPALPFLAILGAAALSRALQAWPRTGRALAAIIACHAVLYYAAYLRMISATDIRDITSEWIAGNIKPGASIGLITEPSYSSPGLIDKEYRHPGRRGAPGYTFVPLGEGDWKGTYGYSLLEKKLPDFVIASDLEESYLPDSGLRPALQRAGYAQAKKFSAEFSVFGIKASKIPVMFYTPNEISVFSRAAQEKPLSPGLRAGAF